MSSAFKIRQGDVAADIGAGVGAANQAITDGEEFFNDAVHGAQAAMENFAGQAVNGAGALAGMMAGGAPAGGADGARLQQTAADAVNTATADASTLATDATTVATDAANVAADLGSQFVNTATNFFGGLAGAGGAGRLQQGNLANDINALGQASLGALHDANQAFDDALDQSEMITNNVISTSEQAFGANGAAVANPDRLQQDPATLTQDATDLSNDVAAAANAGIQTFNDIAQQGLQAFSGLMGGAAAPAAAPAARRLQRFH
ncbi:unnamed protein product [Moneuplotes crassus]|uniref:Uncharacterized protein n=1 Tax=Euplotes crassus TaxID=5936 RepID=A0AAD1UGL9_EUPCR|nr:unnamed protein product [Moneuplotes crassus]